MKKILLISSVLTLLTTSGCFIDDGHRGHARYGRHDDVVVAGPEVVVRPAVIVVH
jgi:hypothetical protein